MTLLHAFQVSKKFRTRDSATRSVPSPQDTRCGGSESPDTELGYDLPDRRAGINEHGGNERRDGLSTELDSLRPRENCLHEPGLDGHADHFTIRWIIHVRAS